MAPTQILTNESEWQGLQITQQPDGNYVLLNGNTVVTTPNGRIIAHHNYELIALLKREAVQWQGLDVTALRAYSLCCTQIDFVAQGYDMVATALEDILATAEPLFRAVPGPEQADQLATWRCVRAWLSAAGVQLPHMAHGGLHDRNGQQVQALVRQTYAGLTMSQRTGVISLLNRHDCGVLLPLMLVLGHWSSSAYTEAMCMAQTAHPLFDTIEWAEYRTQFQFCASEAQAVRDYIEAMAE
ncbi:MAG: hypothetical protein EBS29_04410 [Chloroflexia bacterium]|nr:hypothetical protein [Chloroflexia bacterium]